MPRKRELTWQAGQNGQLGRWKKVYKGRTLYLGSAPSKSDLDGYRKAVSAWRQRQSEIDAEEAAKPKPHQVEYESTISVWEQGLRWSLEHGDDGRAALARKRLAELRARLEAKVPVPIEHEDTFWGQFGWPKELLEQIGSQIAEYSIAPPVQLGAGQAPATIVQPSEQATAWLDGAPARIEEAVWRDRLRTQTANGEAPEETLGSYVEQFLTNEKRRVDAKQLSPGRYTAKRNNLRDFKSWLGAECSIEAISGNRLVEYRNELLDRVARSSLARDTAHGRLNDVVAFVRWLWEVEAMPDLPRILGSKQLAIGKELVKPQFFSVDEVKCCLAEANERTQLYLLLMLNCGMYQGDISDMKQDEVDWKAGTITRKRSKTRSHNAVPTVTYKLWTKTLTLLRKYRSKQGERVLLNQKGNPLVDRSLKENGDPQTNDSIKNAYDRLKKKTKIEKPLKLLRKTSANLIRSNERFQSLEDLFLGHSPRSISDRHYTAAPEKLLATAIIWLGEQYGVK